MPDICGLDLQEGTECQDGKGYIKSFFVSPASETDEPIDCPVYPFIVPRKFDCVANDERVN